jgi:hypothetical protein
MARDLTAAGVLREQSSGSPCEGESDDRQNQKRHGYASRYRAITPNATSAIAQAANTTIIAIVAAMRAGELDGQGE